MTLTVPERRRTLRTAVSSGSWLTVPSSWPVQVLDLSLGGLAFSSPYELEVGRTASVRTMLAGQAFNGEIRIAWSRPRGTAGPRRTPYEIGAVFLSLEESSRRALEAFLKMSSAQ